MNFILLVFEVIVMVSGMNADWLISLLQPLSVMTRFWWIVASLNRDRGFTVSHDSANIFVEDGTTPYTICINIRLTADLR